MNYIFEIDLNSAYPATLVRVTLSNGVQGQATIPAGGSGLVEIDGQPTGLVIETLEYWDGTDWIETEPAVNPDGHGSKGWLHRERLVNGVPDGTIEDNTAVGGEGPYFPPEENSADCPIVAVTTTTSTTTTTTTMAPTTTTTTTSPPIGTVDVWPLAGSKGSDHIKLQMDFTSPLPAGLSFEWGFDYQATRYPYNPFSSGYPAPWTYPFGANSICGGVATGTAGNNQLVSLSKCNDPGSYYGYISKLVIYNVVAPPGFVFNLVPKRSNLKIEIR